MKAYGGDKDFNEGLEAMAQAVQDDSLIKAHGQMSGMNKARSSEFIDDTGNLTPAGEKAFALQAEEGISALGGKRNIGEKTQELLETFFEGALASAKANLKKAEGESDKDYNARIVSRAEETIKPFLSDGKVNYNEDGSVNTSNALQGNDFWNKNAELKSGSFSGSNSIVLGGGSTFSGSFGQGGEVSGTLSSGFNTNHDISNNGKKGTYLNAGVGNAKNMDGQEVKEAINIGLNPKELLSRIGGLEGVGAAGAAGIGGLIAT
ncbi:MAG TPA: hypothetical protein K8U92_04670, partial [Aliarcobacter thereius]